MVLNRYRMTRRGFVGVAAGSIAALAITPLVSAQDATPAPYEAPANIKNLSGSFDADGSSTLGPLTEAAIEEFAAVAPNVKITNGISGSGVVSSALARAKSRSRMPHAPSRILKPRPPLPQESAGTSSTWPTTESPLSALTTTISWIR